MKTCLATAVLLQLLWAGAPRARVITLDPRAFVLAMVENDRLWAPHLDVDVRVDKALLTPAALAVVRQAHAARPPARDAAPSPRKATAAVAAATAAAAAATTTTTVNALVVVVEVACSDRHESDKFDFALAVAASAIKCRVLPYVLAQAQAVGRAHAFPDAANFQRPRAVWRTLSRYLDKLGRMRESLRTGADMYRLWETVVKQTLPPSPSYHMGALGDVRPFVALVEDAVRVACAPATMPGVYAELGAPGGPADWETAAATAAAFDGAQQLLDQVLDELPVVTMDQDIWRVFLDGTENDRDDYGDGGDGDDSKGKGKGKGGNDV